MQIKRAIQNVVSKMKPSNVLHKMSTGIRKVSHTADRILNNPLTQAIVGVNPELSGLYAGARASSAVLGSVSQATNKKNYSGNSDAVSGQILQRAKHVSESANKVAFI